MHFLNLLSVFKKALILTGILIIALSFAGCGSGNSPGDTPDDFKGSLVLNISPNLDQHRTIAPDLEMSVASYVITGTGPNSDNFSVSITTGSATLNSLTPGAWAISVNALNSSGTVIASGDTTVTIETDQTSNASITVRPIDGNGTLTLSLSWPLDAVTDPSITATLTPQDGTATDITFSMADNTASYSNSSLPDGYYTLIVNILDGSDTVWTMVEAVRIITEQTTSGSYNLTADDFIVAQGTLDLQIDQDLQNPLIIFFSGNYSILALGTEMTVEALASNSVDGYQWYLNGAAIPDAIQSSLTIGNGLTAGKYSLSVIAVCGSTLSSKSFLFTVSDISLNPIPEHYPYSLYFSDTDMSENEVSGHAVMVKALNEDDITGYRFYWGSSATEKLSGQPAVATFAADNQDKTYEFPENTEIPAGASYLLAYSYNSNGECLSPVVFPVKDRILEKVDNIDSGVFSQTLEHVCIYNNKLFFSASDGNLGSELWSFDETNGPSLVFDIYAGSSSSPNYLTEFGGKLYFSANDGVAGNELWVYDGNNDIHRVADINAGTANSDPKYLTVLNDRLYFSATDSTVGEELRAYDGSSDPVLVSDIYPGTGWSRPTDLIAFDNSLYFVASTTSGTTLYYYNQSSIQTVSSLTYPGPRLLITLNNVLYFDGDSFSGYELHSFRPPNTVTQLTDIYAGSNDSNIKNIAVFQDNLYFSARDSSTNQELWVYEVGTGARNIANINSSGNSDPSYLTVYEGRLYFTANDGTHGTELWAYDGVHPPEIVHDIINVSGGSNPTTLIVYNNKLYFKAGDGTAYSMYTYREK